MADNVDLDAGTGGATIKTDDDGTAHWQYVKMSFGADNTQTRVTASVGLPVDLLAGTAEIGNVKNSGTFATQAVCTNAGTFATQATLQAGTAEFGKLAAGVAEIGNVKNSGTFATQSVCTNAGTFVIQEDGAALTALQVIDNIVHVDDAAFTLGTSSGVMMMGFAGTQSVNANDAGAISMETDGSIHIHDGGNTITVDGTVTANPASGTIDTVTTVSTVTTVTNDVNIADGGNSITVDNGGTFATQATLQAGTAEIGKLAAGTAVIGEVTIGAATGATGDLAKTQDVAMGANDVGMAMLAVRDDEQAAMTPADGDYTTLRTDKFGNLKVTNLPDATSVVKFGVIDAASSGDNTLQAAAGAGIKIRVLSVMMVSAGTVTARFESAAGGTALTGQMNLVANSGFTLPYNPAGWFETADNALLNLELSGAVSVDGCFTYVEV